MHQTFYIDIDEEITSLISRLRKSKTKENIFVVPRRALILQSAVNLKLLKRESVQQKKQIMIVTQDKQGKDLAEKIGILTQASLEGFEDSEEVREDFNPKIKAKNKSAEMEPKLIDKIGSESFYESEGAVSGPVNFPKKRKKIIQSEKSNARESAQENGTDQNKKKAVFFDIFQGAKKTEEAVKREVPKKERKDEIQKAEDNYSQAGKFAEKERRREKEIQYFFEDKKEEEKEKPEKKSVKVKGRMKNFFILFGLAFAAVMIVAFSLFFLPQANVQLRGRIHAIELETEVKGDTKKTIADFENRAIPARIIEKNIISEANFPATGKSDTSGQKARGKITIYNEFSTAPQPLVATTRFLAPGEKIFRLSKGVTVPGMVKSGGENHPGAIEAEVVADQAGEEYNIGPSEFKIPGFQGSSKYEKFYAKSTQPMLGGNSSGNQIAIVSEADVNHAKEELSDQVNRDFESKLKESLEEGEILLSESAEKKEIIYSIPEAGTAVANFSGKAEMNTRSIVFREKDLKAIISKMAAEKQGNPENSRMAMSDVTLEYGQSTMDFVESFMLIKVHAKAVYKPKISVEEIKRKLAGKNEDQVREVLDDYPEIENMEVEFKPSFFPAKFPQYGRMITVTAENSMTE